ncbi:ribonuclease E inhibitor RraB [Janibacter melonis]|uniref:ribonuclease E inhibitor RraB n=1 Tax=Janibacter melonis TaxID=262209 RepID=UPI002E2D10DD|nr:ribonuclease E inhibitor RraB [Janibacter melonis]
MAVMSEHLIVLPDRDVAERVADDLREEGLGEVRVVREALAGEDDGEDHEWAIYVRVETVTDEASAVGQGLKERFSALAEEHDGWYDDRAGGPA